MNRNDKIDAIVKIVGVIAIVCGGIFGLVKYFDYNHEKKLEKRLRTIQFIEKYNSEPFISYRYRLNYVIFYGCRESTDLKSPLLVPLQGCDYSDQNTKCLKIILSIKDKKEITERVSQCAANEAFSIINLIDLVKTCVDAGLCDNSTFIQEFRPRSNILVYFLDDFINEMRKREAMESFGRGVYAAHNPNFRQIIVQRYTGVALRLSRAGMPNLFFKIGNHLLPAPSARPKTESPNSTSRGKGETWPATAPRTVFGDRSGIITTIELPTF